MEIKIHDFQLSILRELLFKPAARFRDLKKFDVTNDHFTFHVNHLIKEGLIIKNEGRYSLSDVGKEFANRIDTDSLKLERQAKLAVALHAVRIKNGKREILIHQRLKEPFYGWYGSHSGKIRWGENPIDCANREFEEETGLQGNFELKGIVHYHHYHTDGRFLEDKYFWVFVINNTTGDLKEEVPEGKNIWMDENKFKELKNTFSTFEEIVEVIDGKKLVYIDRKRVVESY